MAQQRFMNLLRLLISKNTEAHVQALQDWFARECKLDTKKFNEMFEAVELRGVFSVNEDGRVRLVR